MGVSEGSVVCKFGGTSLADAAQIRKVRGIIDSDPRRRFVVPSAPGKRCEQDTKITDLLYLCHDLAREKLDFTEPCVRIRSRYTELAVELDTDTDIADLLDRLCIDIRKGVHVLHMQGENIARLSAPVVRHCEAERDILA